MDVAVTDIPDIRTGQAATVTPDGTTRSRSGTVVAIGLAGDTSSGSTTYPVTISLDGSDRFTRQWLDGFGRDSRLPPRTMLWWCRSPR